MNHAGGECQFADENACGGRNDFFGAVSAWPETAGRQEKLNSTAGKVKDLEPEVKCQVAMLIKYPDFLIQLRNFLP